jgi:LPXTG-motif cell wall-anchored protein
MALAATGLNTAWLVFAGITLIFMGVALFGLARRGGKVRP